MKPQRLVPVRQGVLEPSDAPPGHTPLSVEVRPLGRLRQVGHRHRLFEVAEGVLIVGRPHGLPAGEREKPQQPSAVSGRARLGQVVGDLRRLLIQGGGVEPFKCVGHE